MAQVSYGTITITDNNDIEKIYMQYAQSTSNQVAPTSSSDWSTDIPTWRQGYYIWQRTVTKMSGVPLSSSSYGDPVCLTGSTGSTGTTGRGVSSIVTTYCNYGTGTPAANYSGWSTTVPAYDSSKPNYWVKTVITYTSGTPATDTTIYKDNGITSANSTAAAANSTAQTASGKADEAWSKADNAQTVAGNASSAISDLNQYFWRKKTASTNVPAGSYVTNIPGTDYQANPASGGYNSLVQADGIYLRNGITTLSSWTGSALTFNNPSTGNAQLIIGANGTLQSGNYDYRTNLAEKRFSVSGTKIDLTNGDIITPNFRLASTATQDYEAGAYIRGTLEALDGYIQKMYIGTNTTNRWEIGNFTNYDQSASAALISNGTAFIQLGKQNTWRLSTDRIHTAWIANNSSALTFPIYDNKYWDWGIHSPHKTNDIWKDKFLYIRNATYDSQDPQASVLAQDLDDDMGLWTYQFWIDRMGNVHAPAYYVGNSDTPIGGGTGTIAEKIINSDSTYGKGSATQPVYIDSNGRPAITTYALNAAGAKGVVTDLANNTTSTDLPTAATVASYVTSRGYITSYTDNKVQTSQANTTKIYLTGTATAGTSTGTLNFDSNVYLTTTAGTLHATTFEGNLSGTATKANQDGDGNVIKSTYLKLSGGNVTGAVTFGSSVSVDELTAGDLVVNGNASFTNNAQFNTINGVAVGNSPKFTDNNTTYTFANGTNGFTVTPSGGTAQTVTVTPSITNNITGSGTSGYLAKFTGGNTIGNGPALGTDTTKFLNNKGEWAVPAGTYTYTLPLAASGVRGGVQIGYTQSGKNYPVQLSSEKMYVNVPWENTWTAMTGATSSADGTVGYVGATPPKSGYNTKYWRADGTWSVPPNDNTHRPIQLDSTEILGNNTTALNLVTGGGMTLSNSSGSVTIAHKDTSSQATSTNSGRTYIQSITLDTYGHVTGLSTATESVTDTHHSAYLYATTSDGTSNATTATTDPYLTLIENANVRSRIQLKAGTNVTSISANAGIITFNVKDTTYTAATAAPGKVASSSAKGSSTNYARQDHTHGIDLATGDANGQVKIAGTNVSVKGLGSWAYKSSGSASDVGLGDAFTDVSATPGSGGQTTFTFSKAGGGTKELEVVVTASTATSATNLIGTDGNPISTTGVVTFSSGLPVDTGFTIGKSVPSDAKFTDTTYSFADSYNASSNKGATVATVTNAINALDGGTIGTPGTGKTITAISQTNGNISVTFGNISITKSQISDFPSSMTPAAHNHSQIVTVGDKRSTETTPNNYANALIFQGLKSKATIGSPSDDNYSYLVGLRGWSDSSGGNSHELAFNNTGIFWRQGATTSWGSWYRIYTTGNKPTASDVGLGNVANSDTTNASNITSGTLAKERLATSGATAGSYGDSGNQTPGYGSTFKVPYITVDTYGRVTSISEHTVKIPASDNSNYYHTTGTWSGLTYTATANGGAGALAFTLPTASASASGVINTSAQVLAGKKTIKYTTRIYPMVGVSNEKSQWYKITFPYYNAETTSAAKWFMNSFDLHFGGGYDANANGVAHVAFYWTRAASNGAWAASQVAAKLDGILMNKITLYYRIAEPGVLYVNNSSNNYNGIWLDNLYVDDTSPSLDWSTTTIETCSAITVANYTEVPTVRTYNNNSSTYIIGNNTLPVSNNTYNLGSSDNKWANIYATTFNGNASTASKITNITSSDNASSTVDWRKVWISYADGVTGRPAVTDGLTFQTSTNTLKATTFSGALSGNASTATKWASAQTVYVTLGTASTTTTIQGGSSSAQTIGVNGTLAIGNGGTGLTASPSMLTNLGSTTAANVLQASPRPGITGTLGAANGGTGQTSLINAANSLLNALSTGSSTPVDNDYYISQYVNGGTTTTTYHRRPMSALWNYISGKISSSGAYVTIGTDQTITANQKTFNGAIRWGTASKYGAAHYDSTLEAIVFSFA